MTKIFNIHTKALLAACNNLKIKYEQIGETEVFVEVKINGEIYHFIGNKVPLDNTVVDRIAKDKGHTYSLLNEFIKMPKTFSFVDPNPHKECLIPYADTSIEAITKEIESELKYPFIIKKNTGSCGDHVFKVNDKNESTIALKKIYDKKNYLYDHVALAQEFINIEKEYRATVVDRKIILVYQKDTSSAKYSGNLSPLHWKGSRAIIDDNKELAKDLKEFISPIWDKLNLRYAGLDIATDDKNQMYLLEINCHPAYNYVVEQNGMEILVNVYEKILEALKSS